MMGLVHQVASMIAVLEIDSEKYEDENTYWDEVNKRTLIIEKQIQEKAAKIPDDDDDDEDEDDE